VAAKSHLNALDFLLQVPKDVHAPADL